MIIPKIWPDPPIEVNVPREAVEVNYTRPTLDSLWPLVRDPELAPSSLGRLRLVFDGLNELSREWKLPEEEKAARSEEVAKYFTRVQVQ